MQMSIILLLGNTLTVSKNYLLWLVIIHTSINSPIAYSKFNTTNPLFTFGIHVYSHNNNNIVVTLCATPITQYSLRLRDIVVITCITCSSQCKIILPPHRCHYWQDIHCIGKTCLENFSTSPKEKRLGGHRWWNGNILYQVQDEWRKRWGKSHVSCLMWSSTIE